MKHLQGQVEQAGETKHAGCKENGHEYKQRLCSIAKKHPANEPNDKIHWEMMIGKLEVADQSAA